MPSLPSPQQPLLPVQHGSPTPGSGGPKRPGVQHHSPAKDLVAAVQQGDMEGALRVASWACLRSPILLLAAAVLLTAAICLAAWLLPQQPLPGILDLVSRQKGHQQRAFFEQLAREEQQLIVQKQPARPPRTQHRKGAKQLSREKLLDSLAFPKKSEAEQQQQQQEDKNQQDLQQPAPADGSSSTGTNSSSEPIINIHEIAKVPPLFGSSDDRPIKI